MDFPTYLNRLRAIKNMLEIESALDFGDVDEEFPLDEVLTGFDDYIELASVYSTVSDSSGYTPYASLQLTDRCAWRKPSEPTRPIRRQKTKKRRIS